MFSFLKNKLTFDFNRAVEDARRDYPEETKNVTFANLSTFGADGILVKWLNSTSKEYKALSLDKGQSTIQAVRKAIDKCNAFASRDPLSSKALLAMKEEDGVLPAHFSFSHELGHLVVPKGLITSLKKSAIADKKSACKRENIADSFAVIHGFKNGTLDQEGAMILASRRRMFLFTNKKYDTAAAIEALIENRDNINFKSLTPQDVKVLAAAHAKKYAPGASS